MTTHTTPFLVRSTKEHVSPWTHWLFYGATGSGKTTAASTFPNPIFLVPRAEGSELTLSDSDVPYVKLGRDQNDHIVPVMPHLTAVLDWLEGQQQLARKLAAEGKEQESIDAFPWETIVLESMTHLCAMLQDDVSQNGRLKMDQQKWGVISDYLRNVHTRLRGLDAHVVFTALAKIEGEDGQTREGAPDITGKMARLLPSACDAIGYCEAADAGKEISYTVHFKQYRVFPARTRFKQIPGRITNFTFAKVAQYLPQ